MPVHGDAMNRVSTGTPFSLRDAANYKEKFACICVIRGQHNNAPDIHFSLRDAANSGIILSEFLILLIPRQSQ